MGFDHPGVAASVLVYLASDGSWSGEQCRRTVTILLSDTSSTNHSLGKFLNYFLELKEKTFKSSLCPAGTHHLSCHRNPLVVNVTHDLSQPFFLTASVILLFPSPSVAVRGVALRTSCHFSTFALTGCASEGGLSHNYLRQHTHTHTQHQGYQECRYIFRCPCRCGQLRCLDHMNVKIILVVEVEKEEVQVHYSDT